MWTVLFFTMASTMACKDGPGSKNNDDSTGAENQDSSLPESLPVNLAPGVAFLDPRDGDVFTELQTIHFDVLAGDDGDFSGITLAWSGDLTGTLPTAPGADGTIDFQIDPLPLGHYEVTITAKDPDGLTGTATIGFDVVVPDADGDGYINDRLRGDDCDDSNASVYPGATEVCDEIDNNCDGHIDEDVTTRYYQDLDGDNYGNPLAPADACQAPQGYVSNDNDCDDLHASAYPNGEEVCDYLDNNCDGDIDEDVTIPYYLDTDNDGYGDPAQITYDCSLPSGYSAVDTDCDDALPDVSPAETEICLDGLDNDCDGTSNQCGLGGTIYLNNADATFLGESSSDYAGTSVAGGDFNNDGLTDLLIGAMGNDEAGTDAGAAYLIYSTVSGTQNLSTASLQLSGELAGDNAGVVVAGAGDYNGDGRDDLLVGAWSNDTLGANAGAVYLVHGGKQGEMSLSDADGIFWGSTADDYAGYSTAAAGDTDGDGYGDILVGAWGNDSGGSLSGAAYLVRGPYVGNLDLSAADAVLTGEEAGDFAGFSVATAGDTDLDGYDDILVGAYGADGAAGRTYLVRGPITSGSLSTADAIFLGENASDQSGAAVSSAGDTDGDGFSDVLIGAYTHDYGGTNTGAAYVVFGPATGMIDLSAADAKLVGEDSDDNAGWSVASAGDMDGDGQDDLLVGAFREDTGGADSGSAYLVYGPPAGIMPLQSANAKLIGTDSNGYAASSVAAIGDTDGDGKADVRVGGPYADAGGSYLCGTAWLVRGTGL